MRGTDDAKITFTEEQIVGITQEYAAGAKASELCQRYGCRTLHAKLKHEGFSVNVKVVEILYREERLTLRAAHVKKIPKGVREGA